MHVLKRTHSRCSKRIMFTECVDEGNVEQMPNAAWVKKNTLEVRLSIKDSRLADDDLEKYVHQLLASFSTENPVKVLIDISSMPRCVMAGLITAFEDVAYLGLAIEVTVVYCLAKYVPPLEKRISNNEAKPVHPNFTGFAIDPGLPVASIVGLGYERRKALGAVEYLQSADWWVFVPTSEEQKYLQKVQAHNSVILKGVREHQKFEYSVHSPLSVLARLESLVSSLVKTHKPVLLPFGPKIFFFCALLTALVHKRSAVWDVSGEHEPPRAEVTPSPYVMCMQFELVCS